MLSLFGVNIMDCIASELDKNFSYISCKKSFLATTLDINIQYKTRTQFKSQIKIYWVNKNI